MNDLIQFIFCNPRWKPFNLLIWC